MLETKKCAGEHAPNPPGMCSPPVSSPDVTDENYWVRLVDVVDKGNDDVKVKLMHISYPARSFLWPKKDDIHVLYQSLCCLDHQSSWSLQQDISTIEQVLA